jgi:hypothetical protein
MTKTATKGIRRATGLVAMAASSLLMMAVPAHAATIYYIHPDWVDGCAGCPGVNWTFRAVPPPDVPVEQPEMVAEKIAAATELLLKAARATPDGLDWTKSPVATKGIAEYASAANLAGNGAFLVADGEDGDQCGNGTVKPKPTPPVPYADAEQLIADGLTTLGQAAVQRDADEAAGLQQRAEEALEKAALSLSSGG